MDNISSSSASQEQPTLPPKRRINWWALVSLALFGLVVLLLRNDWIRVSQIAKLQEEIQQLRHPVQPLVRTTPTPKSVRPISTYPMLTPAPTQFWQIHSIDLYGWGILLPPAWTITEVNRRPEPKEGPGNIKGHDCADYQILNDSKNLTLMLQPTCQFSDGGGSEWPDDAVIVKEKLDKTPKRYIIRLFDATTELYRYSEAGDPFDGTSEKWYYSPPVLVLGEGNTADFVYANLQYSSPTAEKEQYLRMVDTIVSSLTKNK